MTDLFSWILDNWSPWIVCERQAKTLAMQVEEFARRLAGLPKSLHPEHDIIINLQSTLESLQRVAKNQQISFSTTTSSTLSVSKTAQALIDLRDWVWLAKPGSQSVKVLNEIDQQLKKILAAEGLISLEAGGICDYEQQKVIDTQPTDNPENKDRIYDTFKPGYRFGDELVRPQEVIVYSLGNSNTLAH